MLYIKTHDAWKRTSRDEPLFPAEVTVGVIYVLRNPLDVAMSWANHRGTSAEKSVENLCDPNFALSRSMDGLSDQLRQHLGSWSDHVRSWVDDSGLPVYILRYEELRRDTTRFFGEAVRFCGVTLDAARLEKAITFSSFGELQQQEQEKGFRERAPKSSGAFFRGGRTGGWRDELTPEQIQKIIAVNGETMQRFGYLDEHGEPVSALSGGLLRPCGTRNDNRGESYVHQTPKPPHPRHRFNVHQNR